LSRKKRPQPERKDSENEDGWAPSENTVTAEENCPKGGAGKIASGNSTRRGEQESPGQGGEAVAQRRKSYNLFRSTAPPGKTGKKDQLHRKKGRSRGGGEVITSSKGSPLLRAMLKRIRRGSSAGKRAPLPLCFETGKNRKIISSTRLSITKNTVWRKYHRSNLVLRRRGVHWGQFDRGTEEKLPMSFSELRKKKPSSIAWGKRKEREPKCTKAHGKKSDSDCRGGVSLRGGT